MAVGWGACGGARRGNHMANAIKSKPKGARHGLRGIATRLHADTRGNVLMIVCAALIPLMCLIGSGIDLSRAYAAQARLQVACDAAALAGRRAMTDGTVDTTVTAEARKFFKFNFPDGSFGISSIEPGITAGTKSAVVVSASSNIKTSIMKIFGFNQLPLSVTCDAKQDMVNTDIVLVLDTTGSMDTAVGGTKKIASLRSAILKLYDTLAKSQVDLENSSPKLRLRYAMVPYSMTTNTGALLYGDDNNNGNYGEASDTTNSKGYLQTSSYYYQKSRSTYKRNLVAHNPLWFKSTWNGCIEERKTIDTIKSVNDSTTGANDLDLDMIPTSDADTKWAPMDLTAQQSYDPKNDDDNASACPAPARRLQAWNKTDLDTYVKTLQPDGYTYHDTGMIWGGRMFSATGVFGKDNPDTWNGAPVNRHLIFMTDGNPTAEPDAYTTYGVERQDKRITGGTLSEEEKRHTERLKIVCDAIKRKKVTIWVVAFLKTTETLDPAVRYCGTSPDQVITTTTGADLEKAFVQIGQNIGALRLSQ